MQSGEGAIPQNRSGLTGLLLRQVEFLLGMVLLLATALAVGALATWNVADPSFSHATSNEVTNALGIAGAAFADLAMQFFGLSSLAALTPAVFWGLRLASGRPVRAAGARGFAWIGFAVLAAGAAGCFAPPQSWPLPVGLGGVFGDLVLKIPGLFLGGYPTGVWSVLVALTLATPAAFLFARAALLTGAPTAKPEARAKAQRGRKPEPAPASADLAEDEDDEAQGALALAFGAAAHWWYSARGMLRRAMNARGLNAAGARKAHDGDAGFEPMAGMRVVTLSPVHAEHDDMPEIEPDSPSAPGAPRPARLREEPVFAGSGGGADNLAMPSLLTRGAMRAEPQFGMDLDDACDEEVWIDPVGRPAVAAPRATPEPQPAFPPVVSRVADEPVRPKPGVRIVREAQPALIREEGFELPPISLLAEPKLPPRDASFSKLALEQNARLLEGVLEDFGVKGEIIQVRPGPVVTLYELEPAPGIKSSRVIGLADDIARSMSAIAARVAVVPGRNAIGIELPNATRETVFLRELIASRDYEASKAKLALTLGKTINGEPVIADLAKMPHLLVAGTTGSGKSVAINTMILSILYKLKPEQCRLIMIDPKMLELSVYDGIPHLLTPVVTDPKKAVVALKWTVREMETRYRNMSKLGVRNIDGFNARVAQAMENGEAIGRTVQTGFDRVTGEAIYETEELDLSPMPYIVVIIDEMADLMMVAGKEIEGAVQRLAQMARAAGIHVIMATQRPSVDVITGTIKANFPTRISFQVTSKIDSRTILGEQGAEQLLGMGDMLYMAGGGRIQRVHGPFVSDNEVEKIVGHLKLQGAPEYLDAITEDDEEDGDEGGGGGSAAGGDFSDSDDPYDQAVAIVLRDKKASTSYIQRRLGVGYNKAASLVERMEREGLIGPATPTGKREILVPTQDDE